MKLKPLKDRIKIARARFSRLKYRVNTEAYSDELWDKWECAERNLERLIELRDRLELKAAIKRLAAAKKRAKV